MQPWRRLSRAFLGGALLLLLGWAPAAAQAIRGTVTDSSNQHPLEGALVSLVGTSQRVNTRPTGEYVLADVAAGTHTVRVQMIGYAPAERRITLGDGEEGTLDISLKLQPVQMEELVVVGYGEQSRVNLSTAVSSVSTQDVTGQANASVDVALQGKAPGVYVNQNAGNPGNASTIRIRGAASLTAGSQPLYVVDGVPIFSEDISQIDEGGQGIRAASGINADEIESIDVLKDAAAASIYGSRGSNGVVLITTKRGALGRPVVSFSAWAGTQKASKRLEMLNSTQYITYMNEAAENDAYGADYFGAVGVADSINTDWQDQVLRNAPIGNVELAVAGGNDQVRYRVSGGYFDQEGIALASSYRRLAGRVNLDFKASEKLNFSTSLGVTGETILRIENDNTLDGVVANAYANVPYLPVKIGDQYTSPADGLNYTNPVALAKYNDAYARSSTVLGTVEAKWQVSSVLRATGRVGVNFYNLRETKYDSPLVIGQYAAGVDGTSQRGYSLRNRYVFDGFLTYDRAWGSRHALTVTAGGSIEETRGELQFLRGETLSDPSLHEVSNATSVTVFLGTPTENNLISAFGRANYSLAEKYLFGVSARIDGSSQFGPDNKYGTFPGASAAWIVSREGFFGQGGAIGLLKLRGSWGYTGNIAGTDFPYQGTNCTSNYGTEAGYYSCSIGNPELSWERTRQVDLGTDLELFDSRVSLTADWYHKKTEDLIVNRPIAGNSGYTSVTTNVGNMVNKGFEFSLTTVNLQSNRADGLRWATTLNMAFNQNEVTELFDGQPFNSGIRNVNRVQEGQPLGAFYGYKFEGVDPATGDAIYKDIDGDGSITSADQTIIGTPWPDFTGGLTSYLTWKGFDLTTFFQFSKGNDVFNAVKIFSLSGGYYYDNSFVEALDRWQKPGDKTNEPRASFDGTSGARLVSNRFVEDGSYLRLQELTVGYQLPTQFAASMGFANARLYLRGQNVFTSTDYSGYSPDVNSNGSTANISLGTDFYSYPQARTWSFGIQAGW